MKNNECILCGNCIDHCKQNVIKYTIKEWIADSRYEVFFYLWSLIKLNIYKVIFISSIKTINFLSVL
jgi:ferredoxin